MTIKSKVKHRIKSSAIKANSKRKMKKTTSKRFYNIVHSAPEWCTSLCMFESIARQRIKIVADAILLFNILFEKYPFVVMENQIELYWTMKVGT